MLVEYLEATTHEDVVVGFVAGRADLDSAGAQIGEQTVLDDDAPGCDPKITSGRLG